MRMKTIICYLFTGFDPWRCALYPDHSLAAANRTHGVYVKEAPGAWMTRCRKQGRRNPFEGKEKFAERRIRNHQGLYTDDGIFFLFKWKDEQERDQDAGVR